MTSAVLVTDGGDYLAERITRVGLKTSALNKLTGLKPATKTESTIRP